MEKPYVICHMLSSIDGKVTGEFLQTEKALLGCDYYYEVNRNYHADAFACGRVTMEGSFTGGYYPDLAKYQNILIDREDYVANNNATYYAVAFDRLGRLGWQDAFIHDEDSGYDNAHIIEVLTEKVSNEYLAYLKELGISYIFAGENDIDIGFALEKLNRIFGIKRLLLEGGSIINGSFIKADLIDEISLVVVPITAQTNDKSLFNESKISNYYIEKFKVVNEYVTHIVYKKETL